MFYLFKSKESKLKIQLNKMKAVFHNSGMPIDYEKDISEQFKQVFKDLKDFSKPMVKILDGRLADKIQSNRVLDMYELLLQKLYENYIEDTRHWWPGEPYSGMPFIGPNEELELADMLSPRNDIFESPLVVAGRIELEKLLVQQLEALPQLRKN